MYDSIHLYEKVIEKRSKYLEAREKACTEDGSSTQEDAKAELAAEEEYHNAMHEWHWHMTRLGEYRKDRW